MSIINPLSLSTAYDKNIFTVLLYAIYSYFIYPAIHQSKYPLFKRVNLPSFIFEIGNTLIAIQDYNPINSFIQDITIGLNDGNFWM
ncbi:hypothetical protein D3C73_977770 [compost metagenome]